MKKILSLLLLIGLSLFVGLNVSASDVYYVDGLPWELNDIQGISHEFVYADNKLYITTEDIDYTYLGTSTSYQIGIGSSYIAQFLTEVGVDIQTQTIATPYTYTVELEVSLTDSHFYDHDFTHLVVETSGGALYTILEGNDTIITIEYEVLYDLDYDIDLEINYVNNVDMGKVYINSVEIEDLEATYSWFRLYFEDNYPDENLWKTYSNFDVWAGYSLDTIETGDFFTTNYFAKYVEDVITPLAIDETDLGYKRDAYIDKIKTEGITITLPFNYGISLFVPLYYQESIDPWYEIVGEIEEVIITFPTLVYDSGEIWGDVINYNVDGVDYTYDMVDEFDQVIPPIFTVKVNTTWNIVNFNTWTGTPIPPTQYIEVGGTVTVPSPSPTLTGYTFLGWQIQSTPSQTIYAWNYNYNPYDFYDFSTPIYEDKTIMAIYKPQTVIIYLNLNGGTRKTYSGWVVNALYTLYNDTANNNLNEVDFSNMVYRTGYTLLGWYQDEELTTPFNPSTPLTTSVNIYAKWQLGTTGESSPSGLNALLDSMGLLNDVGTFFVYLGVMLLLFVPCVLLSLPLVIYTIISISLSGLWLYLGWFNAWTMILVVLANVLLFFTTLRRG